MTERFHDIAGQRFGRLVASARTSKSSNGTWRWLCRCDCGTEVEALISSLRSGRSPSCGCAKSEAIRSQRTTHGLTKSRTYITWKSMIARCTNPRSPDYPRYGGRGVTVCESWKTFDNFLADMGKRPPGRSLDRCNNDGPYSKENCRWATAKEQANNRAPRIKDGRSVVEEMVS